MTWIQLYDGTRWDLVNPDWRVLRIEHIAHGLARINRFSGQTMHGPGYSVAQHSVLVSWLVPDKLRLPALLHDGHETLTGIGDVSRPAKELMPDAVRGYIHRQEQIMDACIATAFWFDLELMWHPAIKQADQQALAIERACLMEPGLDWGLPKALVQETFIHPHADPRFAANAFLQRFKEVCNAATGTGSRRAD